MTGPTIGDPNNAVGTELAGCRRCVVAGGLDPRVADGESDSSVADGGLDSPVADGELDSSVADGEPDSSGISTSASVSPPK